MFPRPFSLLFESARSDMRLTAGRKSRNGTKKKPFGGGYQAAGTAGASDASKNDPLDDTLKLCQKLISTRGLTLSGHTDRRNRPSNQRFLAEWPRLSYH
jgi:hypothetical protein